LAWERSISITTPQMGEAFNIAQPARGQAWWLNLEHDVSEKSSPACSGYKSG
jgi:hypothetical protein